MPTYEVGPMPPQISSEVIGLLEQVETATIGHWRQWGFCNRGIQPLLRGKRVAGTAVTVAIPSLDSTMLHYALSALRPGDILLVDRLGDTQYACWGGGITIAAKTAGAKAGVVDGPCTDLEEVEASNFPVWCRGLAPLITRVTDLAGRMNVPASIGGAVVMPGDAILCDDSGVLVMSPHEAEAQARLAIDTQIKHLAGQQKVAQGAKHGELTGASAKVRAALNLPG